MKKISIVIVSLLVVTIIFLVFYNKTDALQIVKDESCFSDFSVEDKKVYIKCEITVKNSF